MAPQAVQRLCQQCSADAPPDDLLVQLDGVQFARGGRGTLLPARASVGEADEAAVLLSHPCLRLAWLGQHPALPTRAALIPR